MYCQNCGTMNAERANFCVGCGAKLSAAEPQVKSFVREEDLKEDSPEECRTNTATCTAAGGTDRSEPASDDGTVSRLKKRFFEGRLSRGKYFVYGLAVGIANSILMMAHSNGGMNSAVYWILLILMGAFNATLAVRRLHDIGHSGTLAVVSFIPLANELFTLYLLFKKGDPDANMYGPAVR